MVADAPVTDDISFIELDLGEREIKFTETVEDEDGFSRIRTFPDIQVELRLLADFYDISNGECTVWTIFRQSVATSEWEWAAYGDIGVVGVGSSPQDAMRNAIWFLEHGELVNCGECGGTGQRFIGPAHDDWSHESCPGCNGHGFTFVAPAEGL